MGNPSFLRIASLFLGTAAFLVPSPAEAQVVLFAPRGLGFSGGYGGYPNGPGWPGYNGYGYGGYGAPYGYGGPYYPGLYPGGYGAGAAYPGLYSYGGNWYPNMFRNVTTPGWPVGPTSGDSFTSVPRMRSNVPEYPNTSALTGGALVGTAQASEPAVLDVTLPSSGAEVWVQGVQTRQNGTQRRYVSPPLLAGKDYVYTVRARWRDAHGAVQLQQQNVIVQAGSEVRVAFPTGQ